MGINTELVAQCIKQFAKLSENVMNVLSWDDQTMKGYLGLLYSHIARQDESTGFTSHSDPHIW